MSPRIRDRDAESAIRRKRLESEAIGLTRLNNWVCSKGVRRREAEMEDGTRAMCIGALAGDDRRRGGVAHLDAVALDEVLLDVPPDKDDEVEEIGAVGVGVVVLGLHDGFEVFDLAVELDH